MFCLFLTAYCLCLCFWLLYVFIGDWGSTACSKVCRKETRTYFSPQWFFGKFSGVWIHSPHQEGEKNIFINPDWSLKKKNTWQCAKQKMLNVIGTTKFRNKQNKLMVAFDVFNTTVSGVQLAATRSNLDAKTINCMSLIEWNLQSYEYHSSFIIRGGRKQSGLMLIFFSSIQNAGVCEIYISLRNDREQVFPWKKCQYKNKITYGSQQYYHKSAKCTFYTKIMSSFYLMLQIDNGHNSILKMTKVG